MAEFNIDPFGGSVLKRESDSDRSASARSSSGSASSIGGHSFGGLSLAPTGLNSTYGFGGMGSACGNSESEFHVVSGASSTHTSGTVSGQTSFGMSAVNGLEKQIGTKTEEQIQLERVKDTIRKKYCVKVDIPEEVINLVQPVLDDESVGDPWDKIELLHGNAIRMLCKTKLEKKYDEVNESYGKQKAFRCLGEIGDLNTANDPADFSLVHKKMMDVCNSYVEQKEDGKKVEQSPISRFHRGKAIVVSLLAVLPRLKLTGHEMENYFLLWFLNGVRPVLAYYEEIADIVAYLRSQETDWKSILWTQPKKRKDKPAKDDWVKEMEQRMMITAKSHDPDETSGGGSSSSSSSNAMRPPAIPMKHQNPTGVSSVVQTSSSSVLRVGGQDDWTAGETYVEFVLRKITEFRLEADPVEKAASLKELAESKGRKKMGLMLTPLIAALEREGARIQKEKTNHNINYLWAALYARQEAVKANPLIQLQRIDLFPSPTPEQVANRNQFFLDQHLVSLMDPLVKRKCDVYSYIEIAKTQFIPMLHAEGYETEHFSKFIDGLLHFQTNIPASIACYGLASSVSMHLLNFSDIIVPESVIAAAVDGFKKLPQHVSDLSDLLSVHCDRGFENYKTQETKAKKELERRKKELEQKKKDQGQKKLLDEQKKKEKGQGKLTKPNSGKDKGKDEDAQQMASIIADAQRKTIASAEGAEATLAGVETNTLVSADDPNPRPTVATGSGDAAQKRPPQPSGISPGEKRVKVEQAENREKEMRARLGKLLHVYEYMEEIDLTQFKADWMTPVRQLSLNLASSLDASGDHKTSSPKGRKTFTSVGLPAIPSIGHSELPSTPTKMTSGKDNMATNFSNANGMNGFNAPNVYKGVQPAVDLDEEQQLMDELDAMQRSPGGNPNVGLENPYENFPDYYRTVHERIFGSEGRDPLQQQILKDLSWCAEYLIPQMESSWAAVLDARRGNVQGTRAKKKGPPLPLPLLKLKQLTLCAHAVWKLSRSVVPERTLRNVNDFDVLMAYRPPPEFAQIWSRIKQTHQHIADEVKRIDGLDHVLRESVNYVLFVERICGQVFLHCCPNKEEMLQKVENYINEDGHTVADLQAFYRYNFERPNSHLRVLHQGCFKSLEDQINAKKRQIRIAEALNGPADCEKDDDDSF